MNCQRCGAELPDSAVFCEECGAHLPQPVPTVERADLPPAEETTGLPDLRRLFRLTAVLLPVLVILLIETSVIRLGDSGYLIDLGASFLQFTETGNESLAIAAGSWKSCGSDALTLEVSENGELSSDELSELLFGKTGGTVKVRSVKKKDENTFRADCKIALGTRSFKGYLLFNDRMMALTLPALDKQLFFYPSDIYGAPGRDKLLVGSWKAVSSSSTIIISKAGQFSWGISYDHATDYSWKTEGQYLFLSKNGKIVLCYIYKLEDDRLTLCSFASSKEAISLSADGWTEKVFKPD